MPTITLQVGQCGNQLGNTFWSLLQRQQEQQDNTVMAREWFAERPSTGTSSSEPVLHPRVISVDSEAKVAKSWSSGSSAPHQLHILGHAGCGNNWACGYHFGVSNLQQRGAAWSSSTDEGQSSRVETVLEGIRHEAEAAAGVVDFLLMASLAGGTGSGTGSALLQELADQFPASTLAAVAAAPSQTGDSPVQSINSCLAMQHLSTYAHAVILLDNQALLNQVTWQASSSSSSSSSARGGGTGSSANNQVQQRVARKAAGNAAAGPAVAQAAAPPAGACLSGVNRLASEALAALLWPLSQQDALAGRSSVRQLVATVCADPVTKFVEVCSIAQPAAAWSSTAASAWGNRVKQLATRLPRFDPYSPSQPITTSAALIIARGMPGTSAAARQPSAAASTSRTSSGTAALPAYADSCWCSPNWQWENLTAGVGSAVLAYNAAGSSSSSSWQKALCDSIGSSWPSFAGSVTDVYLGASPVMVAGFDSSLGEPSLTAAVRRSSTGSFMRAAAESTLRLSQAGAYMHWYEQYGCSRHDIVAAADGIYDQAEAYMGAW